MPGLWVPTAGRQALLLNPPTPEQREQIARQFDLSARTALARLEEIRQRLTEIIASVPTVELLVRLTDLFYRFNPETYRESEQRTSSVEVEYPTWLALQLPEPRSEGGPISAELFLEVSELVHEMFRVTTDAYMTAHIRAGRPEPTTNDEIALMTRIHVLGVRNPGFTQFAYSLVERLFDKVDDDLARVFGFRIHDLTATWRFLEKEAWSRLADAFDESREKARDLQKLAKSGALDDVFRGRVPTKYRRRIKPRDLRKVIDRSVTWDRRSQVFERAEDLCGVTPWMISAGTGLSEATARSILAAFSTPFGQVPVGDNLMSRYEALDRRPLVPYGKERYLVHLMHLWFWGARGGLEQALRSDDAAWGRYERARADYLESRALELFVNLLPGARVEQNLSYSVERDGKSVPVELDGLVAYGGVLFLIEAKAGSVSHAALRGAAASLREDLTAVIGDAYGQVQRARDYVHGSESVTFVRRDRTTLEVRKADYRDTYLVTVSLDSLDVFVMRLAALQEIGIMARGEFPWALSLLDLEVIAELLEFPGQIVHYLRRRLPLNRLDVLAMEELDLLGAYLENGLRLPAPAEAGYPVRFTSFTEAMDDYYHYQHGTRVTPAEKPRAKIDDATRDSIASAASRGELELDALCALLDRAWPR